MNTTSIRVSWTPPDSGPSVTGYRVYYRTVRDQGSVDVGASTTEYTITSLVVNDTYIITLVALSEHLPSAIVGPEIIPGKTPVIKWGSFYVGWYGKSWSKGMSLSGICASRRAVYSTESPKPMQTFYSGFMATLFLK